MACNSLLTTSLLQVGDCLFQVDCQYLPSTSLLQANSTATGACDVTTKIQSSVGIS